MHLVDSHLCANPSQYISALLLSLNVMMSLEMPHINVLSKMDLIESQGDLAFNLEFYSEVNHVPSGMSQLHVLTSFHDTMQAK